MSVKGNCTICTDYFSAESDVNVTFCGHFFHKKCLEQWLSMKGSDRKCPQCRFKLNKSQVVKKIFINAPDEDDDLDPHLLKNQLDSMETKVAQLTKDKQNLSQTLQATEDSRERLKGKIKALGKDVQHKQQLCDVLKQQLLDTENLEQEARQSKQEAQELKAKFETMKKIETILNGSRQSVETMVEQYTGSSSCTPGTKQLATFCVTLRQEYERISSQHSQKSLDIMKLKKIKSKYEHEINKIKGRNQELEEYVTSLTSSESTLKEENTKLRDKLQKLVSAIDSPSDSRASVVSRLVCESPAPMAMTPDAGSLERKFNKQRRAGISGQSPLKKPRLSISINQEDIIFSSDEENKIPRPQFAESPKTKENKQVCDEYGLKFVKINSTANKSASSTLKSLHQRPKLLINKQPTKARAVTTSSSIFRVGYNGLGGHSSHIFTSSNLKKKRTVLKFSNRK